MSEPASLFQWPNSQETVADYVARQPSVLERRFDVLHACRDYVAISKPWDTRHDVPRGWGEREGVPPRFSPKFRGDETSAEEFCAALPGTRWQGGMPRFAHQIDFATSGILLACTGSAAAGRAAAAFRERTTQKQYTAILMGSSPQTRWSVDAAIGRDHDDDTGFKMRIYSPAELSAAATAAPNRDAPRASVTHFEVLARGVCGLIGPWLGTPVTLIRATPVSGRRHQIRLHARAFGLPVLGDCAYSPDSDSFRMFLHATELCVTLPPAKEPGPWRRRRDKSDDASPPTAAEEAVTELRIVAPVPDSFRLAFIEDK